MAVFDLESTPTKPLERYYPAAFVVSIGQPVFTGNIVVATETVDTVANRFHFLTKEWLKDTALTSSMDEIVESAPYQEIIAMGPSVVGLILEDLRTSPKHWFSALYKITEADPVSDEAAGNPQAMTAAWLEWGRNQGYID